LGAGALVVTGFALDVAAFGAGLWAALTGLDGFLAETFEAG